MRHPTTIWREDVQLTAYTVSWTPQTSDFALLEARAIDEQVRSSRFGPADDK